MIPKAAVIEFGRSVPSGPVRRLYAGTFWRDGWDSNSARAQRFTGLSPTIDS
jgi:hypothetical protein